jgi:hypothetical protein
MRDRQKRPFALDESECCADEKKGAGQYLAITLQFASKNKSAPKATPRPRHLG